MRISASSAQGELAVLNFISACYKRGLLIARPVTFDPGYDMIVHHPETHDMWRVQVKTAFLDKRRYWTASLHRKRGRYSPGMIHRFVFAKPDGSGLWILGGKRLEQRTGLALKENDWENWELFGLTS